MVNFFQNQFTVSLWGDEAFSAVLAQKNLITIIKVLTKDTSPPLYYFCSHFWMQIFGSSELAIRSLSFAFHLGTVVTVFLLAKYLWGRKTAIVAFLLTFFNPFLFKYAFEGRMYSILTFTTTLSFYFFIKKQWIAYVFVTTTALYSHHFSIFAIFLQFVWNLVQVVKKPKKNWRLLLPFIIIFILYIPWLYTFYYQTMLVKGGFWLGKPDFNSLINLFRDFVGQNMSDKWKNVVLILVGIILLLRYWDFKKKSKDVFIVLWLVLPIIITFVVSQLMSSIFFDRYLLYVIPALILLLSSRRRKVSLLFLTILLIIWFWFDWRYFFNPSKKDFGQFSNFVKENLTKDEFLINYNGKAHHLWETKFYEIDSPIYIPEGGELPFFVGTALMEKRDVISQIPEDALWVGATTSGSVDEIVMPGYTEFESKSFGKLNFVWYQKD